MKMHTHTVAVLCRAAVFTAAIACATTLAAQSDASQNGRCKAGSKGAACRAQAPAPTEPAAPSKGSAASFAFPVEDSRHGADPDGTPALSSPRSPGGLPDMPTGGVPDPPASSEQPLGSAGSSSGDNLPPGTSSSRDAADPDDDIAPTTASPNAPVKATRLKDLGSRADTSEARARLEQTRVADDIKVGLFYSKDGNSQGAYLRFKDAAERAPDDPDVHFYLAESANRLNKRDEAVQNYQAYLRLDDGGDHDKAARKALAKLSEPLAKR